MPVRRPSAALAALCGLSALTPALWGQCQAECAKANIMVVLCETSPMPVPGQPIPQQVPPSALLACSDKDLAQIDKALLDVAVQFRFKPGNPPNYGVGPSGYTRFLPGMRSSPCLRGAGQGRTWDYMSGEPIRVLVARSPAEAEGIVQNAAKILRAGPGEDDRLAADNLTRSQHRTLPEGISVAGMAGFRVYSRYLQDPNLPFYSLNYGGAVWVSFRNLVLLARHAVEKPRTLEESQIEVDRVIAGYLEAVQRRLAGLTTAGQPAATPAAPQLPPPSAADVKACQDCLNTKCAANPPAQQDETPKLKEPPDGETLDREATFKWSKGSGDNWNYKLILEWAPSGEYIKTINTKSQQARVSDLPARKGGHIKVTLQSTRAGGSPLLHSHVYSTLEETNVAAIRAARLFEAGDLPGAAQAYRQAVLQEPANPRYHDRLGNTLCSQNKWPEGELEFREAVRLAPGNWEYVLRYGQSLMTQGKLAEAEAALNASLRLNPSADVAYVNLGHVHYARQDYARAEAAYRRAVQLFPRHGDYRADLAGALYRQGRIAEARAEATQARSLGFAKDHWVYGALKLR